MDNFYNAGIATEQDISKINFSPQPLHLPSSQIFYKENKNQGTWVFFIQILSKLKTVSKSSGKIRRKVKLAHPSHLLL